MFVNALRVSPGSLKSLERIALQSAKLVISAYTAFDNIFV